jgi:hypothetical protein
MLVLFHAAFFLPLRIVVPVPASIDPWWGISLIVMDGTVCVFLTRYGFKKLMRPDTQKEND